MFETKAGYFIETEYDEIMKKVDNEGNVIGFHILGVSQLKDKELISISLADERTFTENALK
jgi:uncharacterized protein YuzE